MTESRAFLILVLVLVGMLPVASARADEQSGQSPKPEHLEFFEKEVRPLLSEHCYECHSVGAKRIEAKLLLDSRAAHLRGGDSGASIVPGDAEQSLLIEAVRYESYEMPPKGKLSDRDIATLERWVNIGAPWPEEAAPSAGAGVESFDLQKRKSEFWVWQPISAVDPPDVLDQEWPRSELDHHILAGLEKAGLEPSADADRTAILRRLYFDLIGLPPTPEEIESFLVDTDSSAVEKVVEQLLDSPHFGERWGRHWLDLVRYAESRGHEFDNDTPNAFQYRDYVIRALNADVPYDQFVREQIAGDLLPNPRLHPTAKFNESILGTGFWFLGEWVHSPVDIRKDEADRFDNMLDVMSKTFLGVTVACARCHDHKFDAISTADYYSLSGFLQSSDYRQVRFESMEQNRRVAKRLAQIDAKHQQEILDLLASQDIERPPQAEHLDDESIVVDYGNLAKGQYLQDGFIFGQSPRVAGQIYLESGPTPAVKIAKYGAAVSDPFWHGLKSVTEGVVQNRSAIAKLPKSGRTLRSPTFELKRGNVNCLVEGAGHIVACVDSHRLVAGPLHKQTIKPIQPVRSKKSNKQSSAAGMRWVQLDLTRYLGHRLHLEFVPDKDCRLSVRMVTQGFDAKGLADVDRRLAAQDKAVATFAVLAEGVLNGKSQAEKKQVPTRSKSDSIVQSWKREREKLAAEIVLQSRVAPAMLDGTGEDDRILIRGNSSKPGEIEPRHFLTAVATDTPMPIQSGSGRLELAQQINDPANPLASRVIVNRIWHHLMGRGIVPTVDDFGFLGQRPTNPELLDHLATRFLSDGRSIKQMIKYIVLSRTYQMSSHASPNAMDADPKNLLWHHRPPRRLEGEAIRDSLLALSGKLDRTAFGAPVPIHLTAFMDGRGRPKTSGPLDGNGRRSIYIAVRRNFLSPFMLTFDTPVPFSAMGRRNVSNVPAQALILLNDPLVAKLSREWSKRALENVAGDNGEAIAERVKWMYLTGFGRPPTEAESQAASQFFSSQVSKRGATSKDADLWANYAHVLVNTKEFIFLR